VHLILSKQVMPLFILHPLRRGTLLTVISSTSCWAASLLDAAVFHSLVSYTFPVLCSHLCAFRGNFKDELEDRTTPDQESEGITCTIRTGAVPAASKPAGRKML
jgi:hypothetical protein